MTDTQLLQEILKQLGEVNKRLGQLASMSKLVVIHQKALFGEEGENAGLVGRQNLLIERVKIMWRVMVCVASAIGLALIGAVLKLILK